MAREPRARHEGIDGAILAQQLDQAEDEAIAEALGLTALAINEVRNGGMLARYILHLRKDLIEQFKVLPGINLAEVDAKSTLIQMQNAVQQYQSARAFLTDALTRTQAPPQDAGDDSLDDEDEPFAGDAGD